MCLLLLGSLLLMESWNIWNSSVLLQMAEVPLLLRLSVYLCVYITFCFSVHWSVDTYIVSISWLLWIKLQWTWECNYLSEILLPVHFGVYTEHGIAVSYSNSTFNFFSNFHLFFPLWPCQFNAHQRCTVPLSSTSLPTLTSVFLRMAILADVSWCVVVVLICISLMSGDVSIFSCVFLAIYTSSW